MYFYNLSISTGPSDELRAAILKGQEAFRVCAVFQHSGLSATRHHDAGCHNNCHSSSSRSAVAIICVFGEKNMRMRTRY